jgi:hypothetical protein
MTPSNDLAIETTIHELVVPVRKRAPLRIADVEYRIQLNELGQVWDVLRNGVATDVSARKKKKSAIDCAIRDARIELETSVSIIVVTCRDARKLETIWKSAHSAASANRAYGGLHRKTKRD